MSQNSPYPEENRNVRLWPWEDEVISLGEYTRSLQGLHRFLERVDVLTLQTLEDLSAVASLVGHDLHVIVVVKGQKLERRVEYAAQGAGEPITCMERIYVLAKSIRDQEIRVTSRNGHAYITRHRIVGFQRYQVEELRVRLPADRDIAIGEKPNVDDTSLGAIDLRAGGTKEFLPTIEPYNPQMQQGFIHILKEAVRDVRDILLT